MFKIAFNIFVCLFISTIVFAQSQTADEDGYNEAGYIKRIDKEASYGAYLVEKEFSFGTGKGLDKMPVVTGFEKGKVEMVAVEANTDMGYFLPYNSFMTVDDYDFEVYYRKSFRSQKYPPAKITLSNDDIFLDDNYGLYYGLRATEEGQRSRFTYNYKYSDAKYMTRFFFHQSIPVKNMRVSIKVPSWLSLEIQEMNFDKFKIGKEVKTDKSGNTIYTYTAEFLPPVVQESSSLARPYFLPHIVLTVKKFTADKKEYNGFGTLADLYSWYNYLYKSAKNDAGVLKSQVTKLTAGKTLDEEKIKSLYYWVQDNIRYIAYEEGYAGFIPQTVQEVYKNKYGDCKGMANLLTEMLKLAGYDAHFAWIGTRDIPYEIKDIRSLCATNHAICVLYFKGKTYFLDGTEKYAPFGEDAYRIQGKTVLVEHGDAFKTEQVPAPKIEGNQIHTKASLKMEAGQMKGHISLSFEGASKNFFHYIYNNIPAAKRKEFINSLLQIKENNTDVSNVVTSDFKNRDVPLKIDGDIEISNAITVADKFTYLGIDFFPGTITGFYPDKDRKTPYDINELFMSNDEVVLTLPPNTTVKSLPKQISAKYNTNVFEATYTSNANTITLNKKLQVMQPVIYPADFSAWKDFLNQVKEYNRNYISIQTQ